MKSVAVVLVLAAVAGAGTQSPSSPPSQPSSQEPQVYRTTRARIAIGRSIHVPADEEVSESVVVVGGSARIDGRVRDGVVVVAGNLDFGSTSDVRGEIVVVGGRINRASGARVRGPVTDISVGDWRNWTLGGLSLPAIRFGGIRPWLTLFGTAFRVALLALLMAFIIFVARAPVARIGRSAGAAPGKAFAIGLLAEILFVPVLAATGVALIITIIGIPLAVVLVPLALFAVFAALLLGFTAMACRVGEWVEDRMGWRADSALLAMSIGLLLIIGPTLLARTIGMAPEPIGWAGVGLLALGVTVEFVVWTMGLGATLMTGFGRWSTVPPPIPRLPQPTVLPATN